MSSSPSVLARQHASRLTDQSPYAGALQPKQKRMPDWDDFRVLITVIKTGSFNRAAEALGLTQPTVSRRIGALEDAVGKRIVERSTTGTVLTIEGQRIFDELSIAHDALERALCDRKPLHKKDVVKLLITDGLAAYWLTNFLPFFYRQYPNLELRIFTANHSNAERQGCYDLCLHFLAPTDPDMVATRLGTLHFIPYASAAYLAECGSPSSLGELVGHRLLDFMLYLVDAGTWVTKLPGHIGHDQTQLFTNSSAVLAEAVRKGAGIALLPTYASLFESDFVPVDAELHFETPFWLCYRQDALEKQPVKIVSQFLRHIFDRKVLSCFADAFVPPAQFREVSAASVMASFLTHHAAIGIEAHTMESC